MNRNFRPGDKIRIKQDCYNVINLAGEGASSTVYLTRNEKDGILYVIKEFNPKMINVSKNEHGSFDMSEMDKETLSKFNERKKRFVESAKRQVQIRNNYSDMMNNTFIVNWVEEANNTAYIGMSTFNGVSYDKVEFEEGLQELLTYIKAIAVAVKAYHDNGFLHLDIKPANIFVLDNSNDFVMLFDFDSVIARIWITWNSSSEMQSAEKHTR